MAKTTQGKRFEEALTKFELMLKENDELKKRVAELEAAPARRSRREHKDPLPRPFMMYDLKEVPDPESRRFMPQALTLARILSRAKNPNEIPEPEAFELVRKYADEFSGIVGTTVQSPVRLLQYHRVALEKAGVLRKFIKSSNPSF